MDKIAEMVLMALLKLTPPGHSSYSQVPIPYCDNNCQKTPVCKNTSDFRCGEPQFNKYIYESKIRNYIKNGLAPQEAKSLALPKSFTRPESYNEGLARYMIIASAISNVSDSLTRNNCLNECIYDSKTCNDICYSSSPWKYDRKSLAFMITTLINYESGLRADVHGGLPPSGRGDCKWAYENGRGRIAPPGAKGAERIFSTCQSYCLGQVKQAALRLHKLNYSMEELVGIDLNSTEKCIEVVGRNISSSRGYCDYRSASVDWAAGAFSMYGTGSTCYNSKLHKRAKTFRNILNTTPASLSESLRTKLEDPYTEIIYNMLMTSNNQIVWVPVIEQNQKQASFFE